VCGSNSGTAVLPLLPDDKGEYSFGGLATGASLTLSIASLKVRQLQLYQLAASPIIVPTPASWYLSRIDNIMVNDSQPTTPSEISGPTANGLYQAIFHSGAQEWTP